MRVRNEVLMSSIKKLAYSNVECGFRNAEFKTKNSIECCHKGDSSKFKAPAYAEAPAGRQSLKEDRSLNEGII